MIETSIKRFISYICHLSGDDNVHEFDIYVKERSHENFIYASKTIETFSINNKRDTLSIEVKDTIMYIEREGTEDWDVDFEFFDLNSKSTIGIDKNIFILTALNIRARYIIKFEIVGHEEDNHEKKIQHIAAFGS